MDLWYIIHWLVICIHILLLHPWNGLWICAGNTAADSVQETLII
jgi:hypothetical protein